MKLIDYLRPEGKPVTGLDESVAAQAGTTPAYLWQIATGVRKASPKLAKAIEAATGGKVSKRELRPDIWGNGNSNSQG